MLNRVSHVTILSVIICVMYEIKRAKRLSQALVHCVTALASLFKDQRMSSLTIRTKYKLFKTFCQHTFDSCPTDSRSSFLK